MGIRKVRCARGLTQKDLAEMLKVDQSTVSWWERGKCAPVAKRLPYIAEILNCSVEELLEDNEPTINKAARAQFLSQQPD